jgi:hypothetical protein
MVAPKRNPSPWSYGIAGVGAALSLLAQTGCTPKQSNTSPLTPNPILAVWQSPEASPEDCVTAVNRWIALGTDRADVERLLGTNGEWGRAHGPFVAYLDGNPPADMGYLELWRLTYNVKGKLLILNFKPSPGTLPPTFRFDYAVLGAIGEMTTSFATNVHVKGSTSSVIDCLKR